MDANMDVMAVRFIVKMLFFNFYDKNRKII